MHSGLLTKTVRIRVNCKNRAVNSALELRAACLT
jgi:hypothetical protein